MRGMLCEDVDVDVSGDVSVCVEVREDDEVI